MTTLVLTLVGADRAGLVAEVAAVVARHGGNWERSQLAELSGAFAGIVEVSVDEADADGLREALALLDGLLTVVVQQAIDENADAAAPRQVTLEVLGNDRPGIVREITAVLGTHDISIDRMTTETRDAPMSGGRLFDARVTARVPASVDLAAVRGELERLAGEIQVDVTVGV